MKRYRHEYEKERDNFDKAYEDYEDHERFDDQYFEEHAEHIQPLQSRIKSRARPLYRNNINQRLPYHPNKKRVLLRPLSTEITNIRPEQNDEPMSKEDATEIISLLKELKEISSQNILLSYFLSHLLTDNTL
jgi:hypothetical protein